MVGGEWWEAVCGRAREEQGRGSGGLPGSYPREVPCVRDLRRCDAGLWQAACGKQPVACSLISLISLTRLTSLASHRLLPPGPRAFLRSVAASARSSCARVERRACSHGLRWLDQQREREGGGRERRERERGGGKEGGREREGDGGTQNPT